MKKIAVIGAGLQAKRRIPAIIEDPDYELVWIVDRKEERAKGLAEEFGKFLLIQTLTPKSRLPRWKPARTFFVKSL